MLNTFGLSCLPNEPSGTSIAVTLSQWKDTRGVAWSRAGESGRRLFLRERREERKELRFEKRKAEKKRKGPLYCHRRQCLIHQRRTPLLRECSLDCGTVSQIMTRISMLNAGKHGSPGRLGKSSTTQLDGLGRFLDLGRDLPIRTEESVYKIRTDAGRARHPRNDSKTIAQSREAMLDATVSAALTALAPIFAYLCLYDMSFGDRRWNGQLRPHGAMIAFRHSSALASMLTDG